MKINYTIAITFELTPRDKEEIEGDVDLIKMGYIEEFVDAFNKDASAVKEYIKEYMMYHLCYGVWPQLQGSIERNFEDKHWKKAIEKITPEAAVFLEQVLFPQAGSMLKEENDLYLDIVYSRLSSVEVRGISLVLDRV